MKLIFVVKLIEDVQKINLQDNYTAKRNIVVEVLFPGYTR